MRTYICTHTTYVRTTYHTISTTSTHKDKQQAKRAVYFRPRQTKTDQDRPRQTKTEHCTGNVTVLEVLPPEVIFHSRVIGAYPVTTDCIVAMR